MNTPLPTTGVKYNAVFLINARLTGPQLHHVKTMGERTKLQRPCDILLGEKYLRTRNVTVISRVSDTVEHGFSLKWHAEWTHCYGHF